LNELLGLGLFALEGAPAKKAFRAHGVENVNVFPVVPIEDAARGLYDLTVTSPTSELARAAATLGMVNQLADMLDNTLHQGACGRRIFKSDVVSYRL